jgi:hypothetical protein
LVALLAASYLSHAGKNRLIEVLAEEISPEIAGILTNSKGELANFAGAKILALLGCPKTSG